MKNRHKVFCIFPIASHSNYCFAWEYVTKSDQEYRQSKGNPQLTESSAPRTTSDSLARCEKKENKQ